MTSGRDKGRPRILFFDCNETLLDLTEVKQSVKEALGGRAELVPLWLTSMLHYSLVTTVAGKFKPFNEVGVSALMMVAKINGMDLPEKSAQEALAPLLSAPAYPDSIPALKRFRDEGFHLAVLTNSFSDAMKRQLDNAGLTGYFNDTFSVEEAGIYKPHRDIYQWAARRTGNWPHDCMLISSHAWDIAGALWSGMRAAFVSRPGQELYPLAPIPEIIAPDLKGIADQLLR